MKVALFVTCLVDVLRPEVGVATTRVLRAAGCDVSFPDGQTCCGQPAWNAGAAQEAAKVARTTLDALEGADADVIVVPAGSCATMVRVYWPSLFEAADDPRSAERSRRLAPKVREFAELVADLELPSCDSQPVRVAYHHSCHMMRELEIVAQPLEILEGVTGCTQVPWEGSDRCCGFGGLFSIKLPEVSVAMADEKLSTLPDVDVVVGCDTSCLMHLEARARHEGRPLRVQHLAELLASSLPEPPLPEGRR